MEQEPTSTIAIYIQVAPDGSNYNVHSRRLYHPQMGKPNIEAWDRITDGILTQLVHDPSKFENIAYLGIAARMINEISERNRDSAFDLKSGMDADNVVVFPTPLDT